MNFFSLKNVVKNKETTSNKPIYDEREATFSLNVPSNNKNNNNNSSKPDEPSIKRQKKSLLMGDEFKNIENVKADEKQKQSNDVNPLLSSLFPSYLFKGLTSTGLLQGLIIKYV